MAELKKVLSPRTILLITINSIMGTGIFFLPAVGANHAGPASIISWTVLAFIAIYISMCFGELVGMFPKAGGVYEYCKQAYGRFPSFIFGWMTLIAGNVTIAMLIVGAIQYLLPFPLMSVKLIISLLFIFIFNFMAYKGMQTSAFMLVTFSIITVGTLTGLIIPGFFKFSLSNLTPFFIFPISAVLVTIFFIAETFFGWETATFLAEETKDAERVMPWALTRATWVISFICITFVVISLGVVPWQVFGESVAPLADLAKIYYGSWGVDIFTIMVYLSIIGSVAGWIVSAPRLILALAQDKLFLKQFAKIHPVNSTPYMAILFQTILTSILVVLGSSSPDAYRTLLLLLVPMVLIMYSGVMISLVVLRYKQPDTKRPYKVPFGKVGPILVVLFSIFLISVWLFEEKGALQSASLGLSFIALGIPLYFLLEMYYDPKMIVRVNDLFANFALFTEGMMLPSSVKKELLQLLGDIKGKKVLEFGCSVGTLTVLLAHAVGNKGKVYATDSSEHGVRIAQRRIEKEGHKHVHIIHDPEGNRVHPTVPKVDAVISVGMIGYVQQVERVLQHMNRRLKKGAKIVFMDYDKFFDVIPNIHWLSKDEEIVRIFKKEGFNVGVIRKQGFAWQYIYIYGVKEKDV